ncbi:MAG: hypothetical protein K2J76_00250 [Oscillospiraceae bacterium]|nr:hypothetical protein [Oscillospiraceae bacterium]
MDKKENTIYSLNIILLTSSIIFTGLNIFGGKKSDREKKNNLIAALFCLSLSNMLNAFRSNKE